LKHGLFAAEPALKTSGRARAALPTSTTTIAAQHAKPSGALVQSFGNTGGVDGVADGAAPRIWSRRPRHARRRGMTPEQKGLVQASFAQVVPIREAVAELFYARLFQLDPSLRSLFTGDMKEQGAKLMAMIAIAVKGLDRLETIVPAVRALGRRHAGYGVTQRHYDLVGAALLWTLERSFGPAFSDEVRTAWAACYRLLADTMTQATEALPAAAD
jgi:hemoglobin-like flavoprotein